MPYPVNGGLLALFIALALFALSSCRQQTDSPVMPSGADGLGIQPVTPLSPVAAASRSLSQAGPSTLAAPNSAPTVTLVPGGVLPREAAAPRPQGAAAQKGTPSTGDAPDGCKLCPTTPTIAATAVITGDPSGNIGAPTATATLSPALAPRFPETPVHAIFDAPLFVSHLSLVRDSFRSFTVDWFPILREERERNRGDCGSYLGWYTLWVTQAPAFASVDPGWEALYIEYRLLLEEAVAVTVDIRVRCPGVAPDLYPRNQDPLAFFSHAYPRTEQMLLEAARLAENPIRRPVFARRARHEGEAVVRPL